MCCGVGRVCRTVLEKKGSGVVRYEPIYEGNLKRARVRCRLVMIDVVCVWRQKKGKTWGGC
jgi:hypothetical protein